MDMSLQLCHAFRDLKAIQRALHIHGYSGAQWCVEIHGGSGMKDEIHFFT